MDKQSPIFSKTYDFVKWLLPLTVSFPRSQRFVIASVLQQEALRFQGLLIEAVHQEGALAKLNEADAELDKLRTHLRLCHNLQLISHGQYGQAARMVSEMGKILGGWKKSCLAQEETDENAAAAQENRAAADGNAAASETAAPASPPAAVQTTLPGI